MQGSSGELREIAAEGLGELVEVTSQEALRPFTVQITGVHGGSRLKTLCADTVHLWPPTMSETKGLSQVADSQGTRLAPHCAGPLIRIIGDRFAWQVKAAILHTLGLLIGKAGPGLKPFVPQLQTTFLKCLSDQVSRYLNSRRIADMDAGIVCTSQRLRKIMRIGMILTTPFAGAASAPERCSKPGRAHKDEHAGGPAGQRPQRQCQDS